MLQTATMMEQLLQTTPEEFPAFLLQHKSGLIRSKRPFTDFIRKTIKKKGMTQQNVFLAADISERFGYKLISGQKHTTERDTIIRLCLAAEFCLEEVQEALILYGMAPLYAKLPRDAAFIVAFSHRIYDIHDVDAILRENDLPPFLTPDPPA